MDEILNLIESVSEGFPSYSVSERTAKFEVYLFTHKIYFKYFICDLSAILFYITCITKKYHDLPIN